MEKKYQFTGERKVISYAMAQGPSAEEKQSVLHRIRAVRSFGSVTEGDFGGCIYSEANFSHDGNAWVCYDAQVIGNALIITCSKVCDNAVVCDKATVEMNSEISGNVQIKGSSSIECDVIITDNAIVEDSNLCGRAYVHGNARIKDFDRGCCRLNVGGDTFIDSTDTFDGMKNFKIKNQQMEMYEAVLSIVKYWLLNGITPYRCEGSGFSTPAEFSKVFRKFFTW